MNYRKTTLKNGLRILTIPMKNTETATFMIMVGVGSRFESEKESGLSHFIEHMMFKGTEKRPTTLSISEELDSVGGEFNAFTGKDMTAYYAKTDAKHIGVAMDVITDMFLNSKLETEEIEREKGTILQEINMIEDAPMRNVADVFEGLLYPGNPLGWDILGNKKSVQALERDDFVKYIKRFYTADGTVIGVAGKIDEKKIIGEIKKRFGEMKNGKKAIPKKIKENQASPELAVKNKKTDQTHLQLGVRTFGSSHKDRFALALLSVILGGNMSSRLFIEIRERKGLAYAIKTFTESFQEVGYLAMYAGVEHKNLELTIKTALQEFRKISSEKVSDKELRKAKDYLKGKAVMNFESSDEVAVFFIDQEVKERKVMTLPEIIERVESVSREDILRVAKNIFRPEKLNLAVIGPHKETGKIKSLLRSV
ncbi:MAG: M16 family metallopeptidase [Patescibacteria group bacterium]